MKRFECFVIAAGFASALAFAVPQDSVLTPGGYRPESRVHHVKSGQGLRQLEGVVQVIDLSTHSLVESVELGTGPKLLLSSGWISDAAVTMETGKSVSSFQTTWLVPPAPTSQSNQVLFYFNGIENTGHDYILQPVLQWGASAAGGGNYWSIASWYVGSDGTAFHTDLLRVKEGDNLVGVMKLTGTSGGKFSYTSEFDGVAGTSLPIENINELVWLNETLEAYGVSACSDYSAGMTAFKGINIQASSKELTLEWAAENRITDCGQHVVVVSNSTSDGEVDIFSHQ